MEQRMSWSVQIFRLVSNRTDPGLFCAKDELTLGGVPLLIGTNSGLKPRPSSDLQQVFDTAYGTAAAISAVSRLPCLQSIARALNAGDLSYAAMLSLMLRLPEIDPSDMERLRATWAAPTIKYDDNESRDEQGRWATSGTNVSVASTGRTAQAATAHPTGRWPDVHRENPNILPAQGAIPFPIFPPLFPGGPLAPQKPKDDDFIFPPTNTPQAGAGPTANDNAAANIRATTDSEPKACPDPSFEVTSVGRTPGQLLYQAQISGLATGMGVRLNGVDFDGCRKSDGTMLDATVTGPWFLSLPDFVFRTLDEYKETIDQAFRQMYAAGSRKIEWHFSNQRAAEFWKGEFAELGYKITVKYTPFIPATVKIFIA
jgi:hypothetical protein